MEKSLPSARSKRRGRSAALVRRFDPVYWHRFAVKPYEYSWDNRPGSRGSAVPNEDVAQRLDRMLGRHNHRLPDQVWIGTQGDPYPPAERRKRLTRRLVEVLAKHGCPLLLITRSALVLRDIDLIREVHETASATIGIALFSLNPKLSRLLDPSTPSPRDRVTTLSRIARSGITTGIVVPCLIPGVNDQEAELAKIFHVAVRYNLSFVLFPAYYSLKNRRIEPLENYPLELNPHGIEAVYEREADCLNNAQRESGRTLLKLSEEHRVPIRIPRFLPNDFRRENFWVAEMLAGIAHTRHLAGKPHRSFRTAARHINDLGFDIRNLIRHNIPFEHNWITPSVKPYLDSLLNGRWAALESGEAWIATAAR